MIVIVCCAVHGVAATQFLDTRRRKDPSNVRALCKPQQLRVYSVLPALLAARTSTWAAVLLLLQMQGPQILLRARMSAAPPADASTIVDAIQTRILVLEHLEHQWDPCTRSSLLLSLR